MNDSSRRPNAIVQESPVGEAFVSTALPLGDASSAACSHRALHQDPPRSVHQRFPKRVRSLMRLVLLLLFGVLLAPAPAPAFTIMTNANGKKLHWLVSEMPLPYYIESGSRDVTDGSDYEAMTLAFEEWERPLCTYLSFEQVDSVEETGGHACGGPRNTLGWVENDWPQELGRAVVAITMTCFEPGGGILGARILFNGEHHEWATDGQSSAIDVQNVATHEVGHFVGIGHSEVTGTTMWPTTSRGDTSQRELHRDDLEAICFLYPSPQPWAPGNRPGVIGGSGSTAERLGVDRAGGCDGGTGTATFLALLVGIVVFAVGNPRSYS